LEQTALEPRHGTRDDIEKLAIVMRKIPETNPLPPKRLKLASLEAAGRNLHFLVRHAVETFSHENNNHNQCHASHGNIRDWTGLLNPGGSP
jgi:hypothetical protein